MPQFDYQGFTNALTGFANALTNDIDKQMKEKAHSDLLNMQANFELEANRFMNKLKAGNDYENWEQDYNKFIKEQGDLMQKNSRNQYTARAASEMLQGYSTNMRKNIENQVFDMRNKDILLKNNDTVNLIMQNDGISGQDKMNQLSNIFNREVIGGQINGELYKAKLQKYGTDLYLNHYANIGTELISETINKGGSLQSILNAIDNDDFSISLQEVAYDHTTIEDYENGNAQYTDITHTIDRNEIKAKAKKSIENQYRAALEDVWNQSANELSEYCVGIWQPENNIQQQLALCDRGMYMLDHKYGGNKLKETKRIEYMNMFKQWKKSLTSGSSKDGSGTGNGTGSNKVESFATFTKGLPDYALKNIANGEYLNSYEAKEVIQKVIKEQYFSNEWTETDGLTDQQKKEFFENNYSNFGDKLLDCAFIEDRLNKEPRFFSLREKYNAVKADIKKNKGNYTDEASTILGEFVYDLVASTGKEVTPEQLKNLDSMINACQITKLDKMFKEGLISKKLEERLGAAEENDLVFTNINHEERFAPGAEEKLSALSSDLAADLESKTGIKVKFKGYEKVPNDETSIPIFEDADGNEYKARTIRDKKNKVTGIEYVDENGNTLDTTSMKRKANEEKSAVKQAKKEAKDATRKLEDKRLREKTQAEIEEYKRLYGENWEKELYGY